MGVELYIHFTHPMSIVERARERYKQFKDPFNPRKLERLVNTGRSPYVLEELDISGCVKYVLVTPPRGYRWDSSSVVFDEKSGAFVFWDNETQRVEQTWPKQLTPHSADQLRSYVPDLFGEEQYQDSMSGRFHTEIRVNYLPSS